MPTEKLIARGTDEARRKSVKRKAKDDAAGNLLPGRAFAANCLSVYRQELDVSSSIHCKDLIVNADGRSSIPAIDFSDDGTLLASGGLNSIVRLWYISEPDRRGKHLTVIPIDMESKHNGAALCLAIASDNSRLYSGGLDGNILVHDIQT